MVELQPVKMVLSNYTHPGNERKLVVPEKIPKQYNHRYEIIRDASLHDVLENPGDHSHFLLETTDGVFKYLKNKEFVPLNKGEKVLSPTVLEVRAVEPLSGRVSLLDRALSGSASVKPDGPNWRIVFKSEQSAHATEIAYSTTQKLWDRPVLLPLDPHTCNSCGLLHEENYRGCKYYSDIQVQNAIIFQLFRFSKLKDAIKASGPWRIKMAAQGAFRFLS